MRTDGQPETLMEAVSYFTPDVCFKYMVSNKSGLMETSAARNAVRLTLARLPAVDCSSAKPLNAANNSPPLRLGRSSKIKRSFPWRSGLFSVWCITNAKNGISKAAATCPCAVGITQKSAWHVLDRIRTAMNSGSFAKFTGTVEDQDETFVGAQSEEYAP